jgi:hypothetical protein
LLTIDGSAAIWLIHLTAAKAYRHGHPRAARILIEIADVAEQEWLRNAGETSQFSYGSRRERPVVADRWGRRDSGAHMLHLDLRRERLKPTSDLVLDPLDFILRSGGVEQFHLHDIFSSDLNGFLSPMRRLACEGPRPLGPQPSVLGRFGDL